MLCHTLDECRGLELSQWTLASTFFVQSSPGAFLIAHLNWSVRAWAIWSTISDQAPSRARSSSWPNSDLQCLYRVCNLSGWHNVSWPQLHFVYNSLISQVSFLVLTVNCAMHLLLGKSQFVLATNSLRQTSSLRVVVRYRWRWMSSHPLFLQVVLRTICDAAKEVGGRGGGGGRGWGELSAL